MAPTGDLGAQKTNSFAPSTQKSVTRGPEKSNSGPLNATSGRITMRDGSIGSTNKEATMAGTRKVIDCRRFPAEKPCSITISGTEDEVLELAVLHAGTVHGHNDTPEFRQQLRSMIQDENSTEVAAA
jgi:hypothetical protein